jgi:hypothetical protein
MRTENLILLAALLIAGGLACNPNAANTNTQSATPTVTSTPTTTASAEKAVSRCYVQIFEDENYQDSSDVIYGPGRWNNMRGLPGANKGDWGDQIDSLKVGPGATVTVWEDENFSDNSQTYSPGTERTNLRGNPDMGDQIDSMEIKCQ